MGADAPERLPLPQPSPAAEQPTRSARDRRRSSSQYRSRTPPAPKGLAVRVPTPPRATATASDAVGRLPRRRRPAARRRRAAALRQTSAPRSWRRPACAHVDCFLEPMLHTPPRHDHHNLAYPRTIPGCGQQRISDVHFVRRRPGKISGISRLKGCRRRLCIQLAMPQSHPYGRDYRRLFPNFFGIGIA